MKKIIALTLSLFLITTFAIASIANALAPKMKIVMKNYSNKELGIVFSYPSQLSFHPFSTLSRPDFEPYVKKTAKKTSIAIYKTGYTQDASALLFVFKKPLSDVLKNYHKRDLKNKNLNTVVYGKNRWKKYDSGGGYLEYYLEKNGETYLLEGGDALREKERAQILKTFSIKKKSAASPNTPNLSTSVAPTSSLGFGCIGCGSAPEFGQLWRGPGTGPGGGPFQYGNQPVSKNDESAKSASTDASPLSVSQPPSPSSVSSDTPVKETPAPRRGYETYVLKENEILEETYLAAAESMLKTEEPTSNTKRFVSGETLENDAKEKLRIDVTGTRGNVGAHTIVLDWGTSHPSLTWVTYGKTFNEGLEYKDAEYDTGHLVLLENLEPDTIYYYTLHTQDASGRQGNIYRWAQKTLPTGGKETSLDTAFFILPRLPQKYASLLKGSPAVSIPINTNTLGEALWKQLNTSSEDLLDHMIIQPEALEHLRITAKQNEIFLEWKAPPSITDVKISSPTSMSSASHPSRDPRNIRVLFGTDTNYGLSMITGKDVGDNPSVPGVNEAGKGFMRLRGLVPGKTYHLHYRALTQGKPGAVGEIGMRDIAVPTPLSGTDTITTMTEFHQPAITKLLYPKHAQFPFISFTTDKLSYASLKYSPTSLQQHNTYYDMSLLTSDAARTKHTMQLENLQPNTLYSFVLTLSDAPIDTRTMFTNTQSDTTPTTEAYRTYSFNLLIE